AKPRFHFLEKSRRLRTGLTIPSPGAPIEDSLAAKAGLGESFRNIVNHTPPSLLIGQMPESSGSILICLNKLSQLVTRPRLVREVNTMLAGLDACGKGRPGRGMQDLGGTFEIHPGAGGYERREIPQTTFRAPAADQVAVCHVKRKH